MYWWRKDEVKMLHKTHARGFKDIPLLHSNESEIKTFLCEPMTSSVTLFGTKCLQVFHVIFLSSWFISYPTFTVPGDLPWETTSPEDSRAFSMHHYSHHLLPMDPQVCPPPLSSSHSMISGLDKSPASTFKPAHSRNNSSGSSKHSKQVRGLEDTVSLHVLSDEMSISTLILVLHLFSLCVLVSPLGGDGRLAESGSVIHPWLLSGPQYPWDLWRLLDEEEEVPAQRVAQGGHGAR